MKLPLVLLVLFVSVLLFGCTQKTEQIPSPSPTIQTETSTPSATPIASLQVLSDEPVKVVTKFFELGEAKANPAAFNLLSSNSVIRKELTRGTYFRFLMVPNARTEGENSSLDKNILEVAKLKVLSIRGNTAYVGILPKNDTSIEDFQILIPNKQGVIGTVIVVQENGKWLVDDIIAYPDFGLDDPGLLPDILVLSDADLKAENCQNLMSTYSYPDKEKLVRICRQQIALLKGDISECKTIDANGSEKLDSNCVFAVAKAKGDATMCEKIDPKAYGQLGWLRNDCLKYFAEKNNDPSLCDKLNLADGVGTIWEERKDICMLPLAILNKDVTICDKMVAKREDRSYQFNCYFQLARILKQPELCHKFPPYFNITSNLNLCLNSSKG
ncbi:MAG: hypothetical protein AABX01_07020 [Candidatus Micrarchaeota archaeon]